MSFSSHRHVQRECLCVLPRMQKWLKVVKSSLSMAKV
jgi:hypothetical protein